MARVPQATSKDRNKSHTFLPNQPKNLKKRLRPALPIEQGYLVALFCSTGSTRCSGNSDMRTKPRHRLSIPPMPPILPARPSLHRRKMEAHLSASKVVHRSEKARKYEIK